MTRLHPGLDDQVVDVLFALQVRVQRRHFEHQFARQMRLSPLPMLPGADRFDYVRLDAECGALVQRLWQWLDELAEAATALREIVSG